MPVAPTPAHERVLARTDKIATGCWIWRGATNHGGYGIVQLGRGIGTDRTHRVIYKALVGEIPEGMTVDHLCGVPGCVNPEHLELVSRSENTSRQWATGRGNAGVRQKEKTHCPAGHAYDERNTYLSSSGRRHCRACSRARRRLATAREIDSRETVDG